MTLSDFCSGRTSARTWSMPAWRAIASAVARLSPVSIQTSRPSAFELLRPRSRLRPQRVGDGDQTGRLVADRDVHRRGAGARQCVGPLAQAIQFDAVVREQRAIAEQDLAAIDARLDALAGERLEVLRLRQLQPEFARAVDDGFAERVLGADLRRRGEPQQIAAPIARSSPRPGSRRACRGSACRSCRARSC